MKAVPARAVLGALPIAALVVAWALASGAGLVAPALLPSPAAVLRRCGESFVDPAFLLQVATTLGRLLAGFAIAFAVGVAVGTLAGSDRRTGAVVAPLVRILAPVPKIALYPALILALGFGSGAKIVLVAADCVFPILIAVRHGAAAVDTRLVWAARAAGLSRRAAVLRVVLPATLPAVLTGSRVALVVGCVVVFLAEMIASTDGLGSLLVRAGRNFQTADMFVPLVTIAGIGLALHGLLALLKRRMARWLPDA